MPMVTFFDRGGYRLNQGEHLRVTAAYDSPAGQIIPADALGIVVGYFFLDNDSQMAALRRAASQREKTTRDK